MIRSALSFAPPGPPVGPFLVRALALTAAVLLTLAVSPGSAAERPVDGLVIQIPPILTTEATGRLQSLLHGPLKRFAAGPSRQGGRFVLLCDFNPDGRSASSDRFGACLELARLLRGLPSEFKGVLTVAYVHGEVRGHSVLPVLACAEIVFSEKARLGPVASGKALPRYETTAYEEITRNRFPAALVRKLHEPGVEVIRVGDRYAASDEKPRPRGEPVPGLLAGESAVYTFALAKAVGLCQPLTATSVDDLRTTYGVPRSGVARTLDHTRCWHIPIEGTLTGEVVEQTRRRIERALRARASLLILELRCAGGDSEKATELGRYLASLNDDRPNDPVETIAYVTTTARNLATFLAFGCNRIIMQQEGDSDGPGEDEECALSRESRLGGFGLYLRRHPTLEADRRTLINLGKDVPAERREELERRIQERLHTLEDSLRDNLVDLAKKQMYPPLLAAGMFSAKMRIHFVERATGASGRSFLTEEEYRADQAGPRLWRSVFLVKPWRGQARYDNAYLTLTARQAQEVGLAQAVVKDLAELRELQGLTADQVHTVRADWLDGLADFLRNPWTSVLLVMVGITCLILELKMPGVGLPGVVAAICFVLFFWAHSQLHGQITWLAVLLFILGLLLIGLEIFVLPGFGVCGISGTLLILASLGLVAYGHWPRTNTEWVRFGQKLGPFGISMLGSLVMVFLIVRYLPSIPILNRLLPRPADEDGFGDAAFEYPMHAEWQALLGAIGVAATPLRPAGKTQFGDTFVDVVAEGAYIMPGTRVQVVEVEGNRVVVKEV